MATKVYPSGDNIIIDQDAQPLLTIRQDKAKYTWLYTSCSTDGVNDHLSNSIEFFDITGGLGRAELITGIQDQAGTPILGDDNIKKYLSFFVQANSKLIVICDVVTPPSSGSTTTAQSSNYSAVANDFVLMTTGATDKTVTFPATPVKDDVIAVKKVDAGVGGVILDGNGNNIDALATKTIFSFLTSYTAQFDGAEWWIK